MRKIITITLNPAIDKILEINNFQAGTLCSTLNTSCYPAGKGINVARTLGCLHQPVLAWARLSPGDISFFDQIRNEYISTRWMLTSIPTRTNLTILDPLNGSETHIRENNQHTTAEDFPVNEIIDELKSAIGPDDLVVLSGSLPSHAEPKALYQIAKALKAKNRLILDSSGEPMVQALDCGPDLIKPNLEELEQILQQLESPIVLPLQDQQEIGKACEWLAEKKSINRIVVSLGKKGAILYHHHSAYKAKIDLSEYPDGLPQTLNTIGSGDAMVAGLCHQYFQDSTSDEDILGEGVLLGTTNLFNDLPGHVDLKVADELRNSIRIEKIF